MKFHDAREAPVVEEVKQMWSIYLNKFRQRVEKIGEFKKGLEVGSLLKLPKKLACSVYHLIDLLIPSQSVKPFHLLKYVILCIKIDQRNSLVYFFCRECLDKIMMCFPMEDLYEILVQLRAKYTFFLEQPGNAKLGKHGTIEGCLKEVCEERKGSEDSALYVILT